MVLFLVQVLVLILLLLVQVPFQKVHAFVRLWCRFFFFFQVLVPVQAVFFEVLIQSQVLALVEVRFVQVPYF